MAEDAQPFLSRWCLPKEGEAEGGAIEAKKATEMRSVDLVLFSFLGPAGISKHAKNGGSTLAS